MSAAAELSKLSFRYANGYQALSDIDARIDRGEFVALIGANGAGKSTLLRCLVRLLAPTAGTVRIDGVDVTNADSRQLRRVRRDVGFIFQHFNLVNRVSAFRNVTHGAIARHGTQCLVPALCPSEVRHRAMDCLERVGLADLASRRVDTLSGGQRQRVAIARSLMQQPKLILADEPVASLDPVAGQGVMELLHDIAAERGLTAIAALHHVDFALKYSQRIIGLKAGRLVLDQPAAACSADQLDRAYDTDAAPLEKAS